MPAITEVGKNGWRQGSVIPREAHERLPESVRTALEENGRLVVVSHDRDVTQTSFEDEPHVELLLARPIQIIQGDYAYAKNPRYLHFPMVNGGNEYNYEAHATSRFMVDRQLLREFTPDTETTLAPNVLEIVRRWLVARYMRAAFPDALNARLATADKKLKRAMKQLNPHLSAVYCSLNSREDLPAGVPYKMSIIGVMPIKYHKVATARDQAQRSLDALATAIRKCPDIEVTEADLFPEDEITLDDCHYLTPLNFTYLSLRDGENAVMPATT